MAQELAVELKPHIEALPEVSGNGFEVVTGNIPFEQPDSPFPDRIAGIWQEAANQGAHAVTGERLESSEDTRFYLRAAEGEDDLAYEAAEAVIALLNEGLPGTYRAVLRTSAPVRTERDDSKRRPVFRLVATIWRQA